MRPLPAILFIFALAVLPIALLGQPGSTNNSKESKAVATVPSLQSGINPAASADSAFKKPIVTTQMAPAKSRSDSIPVVKHSFNHRQQIITGSVVMACLALIMVTMNNYNPR